MNCLQYALEFWEKEPSYKLYYNSEHVVNLPKGTVVDGFLPITEFGYNHFKGWYISGLIDDQALVLLVKYFATED